jgi:hypothetical protein
MEGIDSEQLENIRYRPPYSVHLLLVDVNRWPDIEPE